MLYSGHFEFNSTRFLPSRLGLDNSSFQFSMLSLHFWMANNSLSANNILSKGTTNELIDEALETMGPEGDMRFGQDFLGLAFAFTIKKKTDGVLGKPIFSFSAGATEQLGVGFKFSKNFAELAWNGNKQFEGEKITLDPLVLNALYNREYFIGFAFPLMERENFHWRMGARLRYLQGISCIYMPRDNRGTFYTAPEGRNIEVELDMKINTAGVSEEITPLDFNGGGFGTDLGMTFIAHKRSFFHLSVLDIGGIKFKNKTREIVNSQKIVYNGLIFTGLFGGDVDTQLDSLETILNSTITDDVDFRSPLSTRLVLQFEYRTPMITNSGRPFYSNSFYLTWVQGFANMPRSSTKPFFQFAYARDFNSIFNIGGNIGFGGDNGTVALGAFTSVRAGPLRLGFGVGNITGFLFRNRASGIDFTFQITFASR